jgi:hypothetical protein
LGQHETWQRKRERHRQPSLCPSSQTIQTLFKT